MKRRMLFLFLICVSAIALWAGAMTVYYGISKEEPLTLSIGIAVAVVGLGCIFLFRKLANRPSESLKNEWYRDFFIAQSGCDDEGKPVQSDPADYREELIRVREAYAADPAPRKNSIIKPAGVNRRHYCNESVLKTGKIYYGCMVIANTKLFGGSRSVYETWPAVFLYSPDEYYESDPAALIPLADALEADGGEYIPKDQRKFFSNKRLAPELTEGRTVYVTVAMVDRRYLPFGQFFEWRILPLIADPDSCDSVFNVDCRYWTNELIKKYINYERERDHSYGDPFGL